MMDKMINRYRAYRTFYQSSQKHTIESRNQQKNLDKNWKNWDMQREEQKQ